MRSCSCGADISHKYHNVKYCDSCKKEARTASLHKYNTSDKNIENQARYRKTDKAKECWTRANKKHSEYHSAYSKEWGKTEIGVLSQKKAGLKWRSKPEARAKKAAAQMKREQTKRGATPSWSESEQIRDLYIEAKKLEMITGDKYHIDHVVPLNSAVVCGLHCIANLEILEASENIRKSNTWLI